MRKGEKHLDGLVDVPLRVGAGDLHGFAPSCAAGSKSTQDHVGQRPDTTGQH